VLRRKAKQGRWKTAQQESGIGQAHSSKINALLVNFPTLVNSEIFCAIRELLRRKQGIFRPAGP
jgi:hypothetical protein